MAERVTVIFNPRSANGKTGRMEARIRQALEARLGEVLWRRTEGPRHAVELAQQEVREGSELLVVVGGDGTVHEVVNGMMAARKEHGREAALGIVSRGTGSDFVKTLGLTRELEGAVRALTEGVRRRLDVGKAEFVGEGGQPEQRYFINIADFGFGGEVVRRVNASSKLLGGFTSFLVATLRTLYGYRGTPVRFRVDGGKPLEHPMALLALANGRYFGGGMCIAPKADPADRLFDVVWVEAVARRHLLMRFPRVYAGRHLGMSKVHWLRCRRLEAEAPGEVWLDMDGESVGRLPARFELVDSAIEVVCG